VESTGIVYSDAMRAPVNLPRSLALATLLGTGLASAAAAQALLDDPCAGFKWDVSKERALFSSSAVPQAAGKDGESAPVVVPNRLYQLALKPLEQVSFPAPPGKKPSDPGTFAGIAALQIPSSGSYRISVDLPLWIDVAVNGERVPAKDYEGQRSCDAPHKIVEFDLDAKRPLLLQFSGATQGTLRVTVTRVN